MTDVYDRSLFVVRQASAAYDRMLDGTHTAEDVAAYRAWIVWRRMVGGEDEDFISAIVNFADTCAYDLEHR